MRGGAQSFLLFCDDGHLYVVKFQNNGQHLRVLTNEWLGTKLAQHLGLPVPPCEIIQVPSRLIEANPELRINQGNGMSEPCFAGLQFGSRYLGGLLGGLSTVDYLTAEELITVSNLKAYHGALVFDKWTCNMDGRQAVFRKENGATRYKAYFIDQGYCFNAEHWRFIDAPLSGVAARNIVYEDIRGWRSFEPWLARVEQISPDTIWHLASAIPPEWYGDDVSALEQLVRQLEKRGSQVREMITAFKNSSRNPFPNWSA